MIVAARRLVHGGRDRSEASRAELSTGNNTENNNWTSAVVTRCVQETLSAYRLTLMDHRLSLAMTGAWSEPWAVRRSPGSSVMEARSCWPMVCTVWTCSVGPRLTRMWSTSSPRPRYPRENRSAGGISGGRLDSRHASLVSGRAAPVCRAGIRVAQSLVRWRVRARRNHIGTPWRRLICQCVEDEPAPGVGRADRQVSVA